MKLDNRDDFSIKTVGILKQRAAYICSNPDCKCLTIAPSDADDEKVIFNGVASRISSASPGGPRYDPSMTSEERSALNNGIFFCSNCSVLIDKNNGLDFSSVLLKAWKVNHEKWIKDNLNKRIINDSKSSIINVSSSNQSGGITAGIVNLGEPQRRMTSNLKIETDKIFSDPNEKISISYVSGNSEALNFATEIRDYFISQGFKYIGFGSFTRSPEIYGLVIENSRNKDGRSILVGFIPRK